MTWLERLLAEDATHTPMHDPTLETLCTGLPPEEVRALREERAAILEHEAGIHRKVAEQRAGLPNLI